MTPVIWLDQTVRADGLRLRHNQDGRLGWERTFHFEYSYDGIDRYSRAWSRSNTESRSGAPPVGAT